jgi:hypothetical protein
VAKKPKKKKPRIDFTERETEPCVTLARAQRRLPTDAGRPTSDVHSGFSSTKGKLVISVRSVDAQYSRTCPDNVDKAVDVQVVPDR